MRTTATDQVSSPNTMPPRLPLVTELRVALKNSQPSIGTLVLAPEPEDEGNGKANTCSEHAEQQLDASGVRWSLLFHERDSGKDTTNTSPSNDKGGCEASLALGSDGSLAPAVDQRKHGVDTTAGKEDTKVSNSAIALAVELREDGDANDTKTGVDDDSDTTHVANAVGNASTNETRDQHVDEWRGKEKLTESSALNVSKVLRVRHSRNPCP